MIIAARREVVAALHGIGTVKQQLRRVRVHWNDQKMARPNGGPSPHSQIVFALLTRFFEFLQLVVDAIANLE